MRLKVPTPIRNSRRRFTEDPGSIGNAVRLIIGVTVAAVFVGSAAIWVLDRRDFADFGTALWFGLQTVTTVGYGDVTPSSAWGRVVAAMVMVVAVGFIAVITAAVTSTFVEAAQRRRGTADKAAQQDSSQRLEAQLHEISQRLDRIERRIGTDDVSADDRQGR